MKTKKTIAGVFLLFLFVSLFANCSKEEVQRGSVQPIKEDVFYKVNLPQPLAPDIVDKQLVLGLINEARKKGCYCGDTYAPPVNAIVWSNSLELAAKNHSEDMNVNAFMSHSSSNGAKTGDRIKEVGYKFSSFGENLAVGITTEELVVDAWLKSESHCKIIMGNRFKEMGVATSGSFWSQVFASSN